MIGERLLKASLALVLLYLALCYLAAAVVSAIEMVAQIRIWISNQTASQSLGWKEAITVAHNGKHHR